jgi:hypothetical protein
MTTYSSSAPRWRPDRWSGGAKATRRTALGVAVERAPQGNGPTPIRGARRSQTPSPSLAVYLATSPMRRGPSQGFMLQAHGGSDVVAKRLKRVDVSIGFDGHLLPPADFGVDDDRVPLLSIEALVT